MKKSFPASKVAVSIKALSRSHPQKSFWEPRVSAEIAAQCDQKHLRLPKSFPGGVALCNCVSSMCQALGTVYFMFHGFDIWRLFWSSADLARIYRQSYVFSDVIFLKLWDSIIPWFWFHIFRFFSCPFIFPSCCFLLFPGMSFHVPFLCYL